jgi:hypothetical protein
MTGTLGYDDFGAGTAGQAAQLTAAARPRTRLT